jgi:hypothetical protein
MVEKDGIIEQPKKKLGINWNPKNLTTFSTWIQVASYKIECLDSAIHKNRIIIQQSVIAGLILSTISGSISITQFGNFGENLRFIFNLIFTLMSFNIAFITGYIKTFQIQEKLEEYLQLKQNWIAFSASITAELQLPKELRRDAEIIIAENKEKYHQKYLKYKESHQEQIKERGTTRCVCGCGKEYNLWNKSTHQKTIFHQNWMKENS